MSLKKFMFLVRNAGDGKADFTPDIHTEFVKKCEVYIGKLKSENRLIAAQPLLREGALITKTNGKFNTNTLDLNGSVQVGYYHILAKDLEEAIEIAKQNPEFDYVPHSSIEVRPLKMKEQSTGFNYPGRSK